MEVIFAGDTHTFRNIRTRRQFPSVVTVGGKGTNKNLLPLYVVVEIYSDGSYNATSVPYEQKVGSGFTI